MSTSTDKNISKAVQKTDTSGSEFGNKNSFAKKFECSEENSPPQAKKFWGFCEAF